MPCDPKTDVSLMELIIRRRVARSQERQHATDRASRLPMREPRTVRIDIDAGPDGAGAPRGSSAALHSDRGGVADARSREPLSTLDLFFARAAGISE